MSWVTIIAGVIQLLLLLVSSSMETNAEVKKKKEALIKELSDALKNRDPSAITSVFDQLR